MPNSRSQDGGSLPENANANTGAFMNAGPQLSTDVETFRDWFAEHFSLDGQPYTLDLDQARAVLDNHKNTLVTARAGSGKTRVIVAKVAYLLATEQLAAHEIAAFMFNRTAAQEVNQRIAKVEFDGRSVAEIIEKQRTSATSEATKHPSPPQGITIASTFHKFALDIVKLSGARPELISEVEHNRLVRQSLSQALKTYRQRISPREFNGLLQIISGFVARAGQKYSGTSGLAELRAAMRSSLARQSNLSSPSSSLARQPSSPNPNSPTRLPDSGSPSSKNSLNPSNLSSKDRPDPEKVRLYRLAFTTYAYYLSALRPPKLDFNIMMAQAGELLHECALGGSDMQKIRTRIAPLKLILIDEYQDFSQLFLNLVQSIRTNCPAAHLFAVGDDWQAINRFAGSDVDYFINFAQYFPEDTTNIPLMTNYRSCRHVVENANDYMLEYYDPTASRAVPFSQKSGKIIRQNPIKTRFDASDIHEDALGDARYQLALARAAANAGNVTANAGNKIIDDAEISTPAAQLLKTVVKIIRKNSQADIMLLHRHNFTTFPNVSLETFYQALRSLVTDEGIMDAETFTRQIRCMTIHKSKGLEAGVVILLETNRDLVLGHHPTADLWEIFGDSLATEKADQHRLLYVAMTRAKQKLYILSTDKKSPF